MIDGSRPPANTEDLLNKSDYIEDGVDVYERFVEEELYNQEELPSEVSGELENRGLDYKDPDHAMRLLAVDLAMEADELVDKMDELSGYFRENWQTEKIPEVAKAKAGEIRVREAGTEEWCSHEVDPKLPNEHYSPGRIYAENNKEEILAAEKLVAQASGFLTGSE